MNDSRRPNSKRRWYEVSLWTVWTVAIAVLMLSLFSSWLGGRLQRAARNRQAMAQLHRVAFEIWSHGGNIDYECAERRPSRLDQLLGDPGVFDVEKVSMVRATEADLQLLQGLDGMLGSWDLDLSRSHVTGAMLERLQKFGGLRELDLSRTGITDAGLEHLHWFTGLRVLRLENTQVSALGISDLHEALPNARIIPSPTQLTAIAEIKKTGGAFYWQSPRVTISFSRLHHLDITDAVLVHVEALADPGEQMDLDLTGTQISDAGLERLECLTRLRSLMLGNTPITDAGLEHLKGLSQLQYLGLDQTRVTDAGLEHLKGLSQLQHLSLHQTQVTDAGLAHLNELTNLGMLTLNSTQVTDAGLAQLTGLTRLYWLNLANTQVTDAGLVHLRKLTGLRRLSLRATPVADEGLEHLIGLANLGSLHDTDFLDLTQTQVTDQGIEKLRQALPKCRIAASCCC